MDQDGKQAYGSQNEPYVFFLCQTFGTHDKLPIRHVTLPVGKAIFMPIINWISVVPEDGNNDQELLIAAKRKIDAVETLDVSINSSKLNIDPDLDRVSSSSFNVYLPKNNILDTEEGNAQCLSDGYWLFFVPMKKRIRLSSFGSCSSGINKIGVTYMIDFVSD